MTTLESSVQAHPTHRLALVVIAAAQLMVMLDMTIVNVALPSIQRELHFSTTNLAWVIDAYILVFGGLLLLGGRMGDLYGRRRVFIWGVALFTGASLLGGLAPNQGWLLAARALQGVGGAIVAPAALALIQATFQEGPERHRAMAVYAGMNAAGGALGLVLGGLIVEISSWRGVMFVNVPIGLFLLVLAPRVLHAIDGHRGRLDVPGALAISASMALVVYGLIRAPGSGWTNGLTLTSLVAGVALLVIFAVIEARTAAPLVPKGFLRARQRSGAAVMFMLLSASMLSLLFFLTQFLQEQMGYSSLMAGVAYLPIPFFVATTSLTLTRVVRRVGARPFLLAGPLLIAFGLFLASSLTPGSSYGHVFVALAATGLGMGFSFVPLTMSAVAGVAGREQGLASSILNMSQQIGGSLGLAVLVTISATAIKNQVQSSLAHASGAVSMRVLEHHAAVHGFQVALRAGALGALGAFVIALVIMGRQSRAPHRFTSAPAKPQHLPSMQA